MDAEADLAVTSVHKAGGAVEQEHDLLEKSLRRCARIREAVTDMPGARLLGHEVVRACLTVDLDR